MEVVIGEQSDIGRRGADVVVEALTRRSAPTLGVATGSSPLGIYAELGARVRVRNLSLANTTAFMLDEYVGLPPNHPQRYRTVIEREFCAEVDIDPAAVHGPDGLASDLPGECAAYEAAIAQAGGIDVQILGLGSDGHIAFNEPGSSLGSRTRIKTLTRQTRLDNARFFDGDLDAVPQHCLTQGIATIMDARHLLVVASGPGKADAVQQLVEGPVSALWPATALQWHPHVTVLLDEAAASKLQRTGYYTETFADKPAWQGF